MWIQPVNEANGLFKANGRSRALRYHNATIQGRFGRGQWLRSTKRIEENTEILVRNGDEYIQVEVIVWIIDLVNIKFHV